jgi:hypothetical protein
MNKCLSLVHLTRAGWTSVKRFGSSEAETRHRLDRTPNRSALDCPHCGGNVLLSEGH